MNTEKNVQNSSRESEIIEFELRRILNAILNNLWKILLVTLLCGLAMLFYSKMFVTPMYSASTSFYVRNKVEVDSNTNSISSENISTSKRLVNSYIVTLKSRNILMQVIEYADLDMSTSELGSMITAADVSDTEILKVTVSSSDPEEAAKIANAIADIVPTQVSSVVQGSSAKVVDYAVVPTSPYSPDHFKNTLFGLLIGLVVSVAIVLIIEISDVTIMNDDDIGTCCNYPVLAVIPNMSRRMGRGYYYYRRNHRRYGYYATKKKNSDDDDSDNESITTFVGKNTGFAASEAYKLLRTKLQYSFSDDQNCHVFVVSSALAGEGKSISSVNLAYSFAQLNKRVLLVDCDMRRPTLARKLSLARYPGLSECLTGLVSLEELIQVYKEDEEQVPIHVITAGNTPPNPVELMNSSKMVQIIESLRGQYDYIVLDMPPITDVSDALVAPKLADGVLLVVHQNYSSRTALRNAVKQFEFVDAKILGIIFNCVTDRIGGYRQKRYGNRYSHYYTNQHYYGTDTVMAENKPSKKKKRK